MSKRASRTRHALVGYAFLSPALIGVLLFMVVPIGVIMWVSLYRWDLIGDTRYVGLANVTNVLSDPAFLSSLRTTILFVLLVVPIQIILGLLLANLLTKGVRGTVVYRTLIVIPWIAPPLALGVVWSWIFAPTGGLLSALAGTRLEILVSPTWALPAAAFVVVWSRSSSSRDCSRSRVSSPRPRPWTGPPPRRCSGTSKCPSCARPSSSCRSPP